MDDFDIFLFSNTSMESYSGNTLTKFTTVLPQPIYFNENHRFRVALTDLILPPLKPQSDEKFSKDIIVFYDFDYLKLKSNNTFFNFIDVMLRMNALSVEIYDREYFNKFLNKDLDFHVLSLPLTTLGGEATALLTPDYVVFPLELINRIDHDTPPSSVLPPFNVKDPDNTTLFSDYLNNSYVKLSKYQGYRLSQVLYRCLLTILYNLRLEGLPKEFQQESFKSLMELHQNEHHKNDFYRVQQAMRKYIQASNNMIHNFIEHFVSTVEDVRDSILNERNMTTIQRKSNFILAYSDICSESIIGDRRGRLLNLYKNNSRSADGFNIHDPNPRYVPVDKTIIREISIVLTDENGIFLNLVNSSTPSCVVLNFQKMNK